MHSEKGETKLLRIHSKTKIQACDQAVVWDIPPMGIQGDNFKMGRTETHILKGL